MHWFFALASRADARVPHANGRWLAGCLTGRAGCASLLNSASLPGWLSRPLLLLLLRSALLPGWLSCLLLLPLAAAEEEHGRLQLWTPRWRGCLAAMAWLRRGWRAGDGWLLLARVARLAACGGLSAAVLPRCVRPAGPQKKTNKTSVLYWTSHMPQCGTRVKGWSKPYNPQHEPFAMYCSCSSVLKHCSGCNTVSLRHCVRHNDCQCWLQYGSCKQCTTTVAHQFLITCLQHAEW